MMLRKLRHVRQRQGRLRPIFTPGGRTLSSSSPWTKRNVVLAAEARFEAMRTRYEELCASSVSSGKRLSPAEAREVHDTEELLALRNDYNVAREEASDLSKMMAEEEDAELAEEARRELEEIVNPRIDRLEDSLVTKLLPKEHGDDATRALIEVRAAAGGDEATSFAREIFNMYERFCDGKSWKWELLDASKSEFGGFKEAIAIVSGTGAYGELKFESGVHRVQRIPSNDTKIQTSTVTVVVMPHLDAQHATQLSPADIRIDTFRASGAGGQHVNTTDSAVRITHLETGITASIQDERSQHQNKAKALKVLAAKIDAHKSAKLQAERQGERANLIGSGERSERIRTYNFPNDRVVDHRINHTSNSVERVLSAELLPEFTLLLATRDRDLRIKEEFSTSPRDEASTNDKKSSKSTKKKKAAATAST